MPLTFFRIGMEKAQLLVKVKGNGSSLRMRMFITSRKLKCSNAKLTCCMSPLHRCFLLSSELTNLFFFSDSTNEFLQLLPLPPHDLILIRNLHKMLSSLQLSTKRITCPKRSLPNRSPTKRNLLKCRNLSRDCYSFPFTLHIE